MRLGTAQLFGPQGFRGIVGGMPSGNTYSVQPTVSFQASLLDVTVLLDRGFTTAPPSSYILGSRTLTSAQILAGVTSPVPIVEAPPVGSAIVVTGGVYIFVDGSTAYTEGSLGLFYNGGAFAGADQGDNGICNQPESSISLITPVANSNISFANVSGLGVVYGSSSSTPYTAGNGTLSIVVFGFEVPLS